MATTSANARSIVALAQNPRDLNVLLIGYSGGIAAYDFRQAAGVKFFEAVHAPGSPGGGSYANAERLWTERSPPVTTLAWRDDGLVFCAGHADGCLSFWAYADEKPLTVRTLTHEDVHIADAEALLAAGALRDQLAAKAAGDFEHVPVTPAAVADREPVYKLAWASFTGAEEFGQQYASRGESLLVVLGGQASGEKPGISVLQLPAYAAPAPQKGGKKSPQEGLSRAERAAFRASVNPTGVTAYRSRTPPEDFLLLSSSPYFGQAQDASALVVLLTPDPQLPALGRELEAYAFPPVRSEVEPPVLGRKDFALPGEGDVMAQPTTRKRRDSIRRFPWSADRTSTISSRSVRRARDGALAVPSGIWAGVRAILGAKLVSIPDGQFGRLLAGLDGNRVPLRGGLAVPDLRSSGAPDPKLHEGYRVMVSWHADATVRFHDVSPQLLLQVPLAFEFPNPLGHLTIDVARILRETHGDGPRPVVVDVALAAESLECAIALASGQVLVAKFGEAEARQSSESPSESPIVEEPAQMDEKEPAPEAPEVQKKPQENGQVDEKDLASQLDDVDLNDELEDISLEEDDDEAPALYRGWDGRLDRSPSPEPTPEPPATQVVSLTHLARWDRDGFKPVCLFELSGRLSAMALSDIGFLAVGYGPQLVLIDMRGPRVMHVEVLERPVCVLKWAVCGVGSDATRRPRLFAVCDGTTRVYPLVNQKGWAAGKPATFNSLEAPVAAFVLDPESGEELSASGAAFAASMREEPHRISLKAKTHCVYLAVSRTTARASANVTGDRLAKAQLVDCSAAAYVQRNGGRVLAAITPGYAEFLSVPKLEQITKQPLGIGEPRGTLSFEPGGDFLEYTGPGDVQLKTLFNFRKSLPARIDPAYHRENPGPVPQPLNAGVFSWMWANAPLTGAQLDSIVGGPDRVVPKPPPAKGSIMAWAEPASAPKREVRRGSGAQGGQEDGGGMNVGGIYAELQQKFKQREEVMNRLEESAEQLANSATGFVEAARKAAMAEATKSSARGFFKF